MMVKLFRDHYEHRDGKVIRHRAGSVVDLPKEVVEQVNLAEIEQRRERREFAAKFLLTPEGRRAK